MNKQEVVTRALEDLRNAEKLDPTLTIRTSIYYSYVHAYTELGQYNKALEYMDKVIARAKLRVPQNKKEIAALIPWRKDLVTKAQL